jgi:hypothetical protein
MRGHRGADVVWQYAFGVGLALEPVEERLGTRGGSGCPVAGLGPRGECRDARGHGGDVAAVSCPPLRAASMLPEEITSTLTRITLLEACASGSVLLIEDLIQHRR